MYFAIGAVVGLLAGLVCKMFPEFTEYLKLRAM